MLAPPRADHPLMPSKRWLQQQQYHAPFWDVIQRDAVALKYHKITLENTTLFMLPPPHSPNITTIHVKITKNVF